MKLAKTSSALILSHFNERTENAGFPPQLIREYLLQKIETVVYLEHAFPHSKDTRSSVTVYKNGSKIKTIYTFPVKGPQVFFYFIDIFITWYLLLRVWCSFDLCVALDNLNTISVYPLRVMGIIKKLVYYTIDYTPIRFPNKILNLIYHSLDRISCYSADAIWILSSRMVPARQKNGIDNKKSAPSILLPMGADISNINVLPFAEIHRYQLVFVGHLLKKQGLQCIIDALPAVKKQIPQIHLLVIGQGEYKDELIKKTKQLKIEKYVTFSGFIEHYKDVEKLLCTSAVGLAPYIPSSDNYTYYTDPGKPKLYLACGLPVIITDLPESAQVIEKSGAGLCISYKKQDFERAIVTLLKDDYFYTKYRNNAIKLSKKYDINELIKNAIQKV